MFKKISKIMHIIGRGIGAIIAVSLMTSLISNYFSADEIAAEHQRVIADFKLIQHPKDVKEISHTEGETRGPIYSVEYQYTLDDESVEDYYDKELKKRGWEKEEWRKYDPPKSFSYAKDKNSIGFSKKNNNIWKISLYYQIHK